MSEDAEVRCSRIPSYPSQSHNQNKILTY